MYETAYGIPRDLAAIQARTRARWAAQIRAGKIRDGASGRLARNTATPVRVAPVVAVDERIARLRRLGVVS